MKKPRGLARRDDNGAVLKITAPTVAEHRLAPRRALIRRVPTSRTRAPISFMVCAGIAAVVAGCASIPADVDSSLRTVQDGGDLRVGITHNPPWTDMTDRAEPAGREVRLVEDFAASLDADVVWTEGSEALLTDQLQDRSLDLVIGGFTDDTPWTDKAAMTVPYAEESADGETKKHVMLTVLGENQFLTTLETFLIEQGGAR